MHPKLGTSAAQSLGILGASDPKLAQFARVVAITYYTWFCASTHSGFVLPLTLQLISPMLKKDAKSVLYAIAVRLLCKIWIITDWAFPNLQSSIERRDSVVRALGLESLSYLCEADVVDFYTAWKFISKELLDYSSDPTVSHGLCILLRWGEIDAEAYSGTSKNQIQTLWSIGTYKKNNADPLWIRARGTAFHSLSHYKVSFIQDAIPDLWRRNYEFFTNEYNLDVLKSMENFQAEIIKFEHINRRRVDTDKRTTVHKFEKLLDVFPQAVFKGKSSHHLLPGAALLAFNFPPKDILHEGKSKDLARVHAAYEQALVEMAESMYISRNIVVALLALHSWKSFVSHWMQAVVALLDIKESLKLNEALKAANDILKVVPPTAQLVISSASDFLMKWLFQYEHEHQQWSAAISLGLIFNCFHPTDKKSKLQVINGLFEVI